MADATVQFRMAKPTATIPADTSLELSAREMKDLLDAVRDRVVAHVASLPAQPAADVEGAGGARPGALRARAAGGRNPRRGDPRPPLRPRDPEELQHGGARVPRLHPGRRALRGRRRRPDLGCHEPLRRRLAGGPALVQLETNVVRWLCGLVGLPAGSGGYLATGGSLATFTAVVAARREKLPRGLPEGDALRLRPDPPRASRRPRRSRGSPAENVRSIPSDERFRIRVDLARRADRGGPEAGLHAVLRLRRTPGRRTRAPSTTSTRSRTSAREERLWFHVDGGLRRLLPPHRAGPEGDGRHREGRLGRPRPAQGPLPPVRHRGAPRPRRRGPAPRARRGRRLPPAHAGGPGLRRLLRDLAGALARPFAASASGCR